MLRLVYRSYGGENWKNRPSYYSKRLALLSFVRAAEAVGSGAEALFVNDGPVPGEILRIQQSAGRVVELPRVGMRGSYVFGLRTPDLMGWADDDLVWFSEDDYLYRSDAFVQLVKAAEAMPEAAYFALYGFVPGQLPDEQMPPRPRGWQPGVAGLVDGVRWERILSTTSSFGGRVGAIRADYGIFRFCMVPHKKMFRDHDTCVVVQGYEPHPYSHLAWSVVAPGGRTAKEWARDATLLPFLVATNLRAHRRLVNRRQFVAAVPNLATHLEADKLAPGADWETIAAGVEAWAALRPELQASAGPSRERPDDHDGWPHDGGFPADRQLDLRDAVGLADGAALARGADEDDDVRGGARHRSARRHAAAISLGLALDPACWSLIPLG